MKHEKIVITALLLLFLFSTVACVTVRREDDKDMERFTGYRTMFVIPHILENKGTALARAEVAATAECELEGQKYKFVRMGEIGNSINYVCGPKQPVVKTQEFIVYGAAKRKH